MDLVAENNEIDIQTAVDLTHTYIGPTCADVDFHAHFGFGKMQEMIETEILNHQETLTLNVAKALARVISNQLSAILDDTVEEIKQVGTISMRDALADMAYDLLVKIDKLERENAILTTSLEEHKLWGFKSQTTIMFERLKDERVR